MSCRMAKKNHFWHELENECRLSCGTILQLMLKGDSDAILQLILQFILQLILELNLQLIQQLNPHTL